MSKSACASPPRPASARAALRGRSGASALEFALVGALFFVTVLAVLDIGRYFMTVEGLRNFSADAMRHGIVNLRSSRGQVCRDALVQAMGRSGVVQGLVTADPGVCVTRTETTASGITTVKVRVTTDVTFRFVMNVFGIGTQRISHDTTFSFQE
ncbi:TadE family protein [Roseomonas sp. HF4]|uniref:TadE family protein n=1 Tax=Roseomonas sp. HF4 TaxID=2562313 RepID=UPI0010C143A3|nr:TadE/TadG family type IV pilus assembly protein [Roseomonas sp. HF4]